MRKTYTTFARSDAARYWNKPMIVDNGVDTVAKLGLLREALSPEQLGGWMRGSSTTMATTELKWTDGKALPIETPVPEQVTAGLQSILDELGNTKGVPDLAIWDKSGTLVRVVEAKRRDNDALSTEQIDFLKEAAARGIDAVVGEWDFETSLGKPA